MWTDSLRPEHLEKVVQALPGDVCTWLQENSFIVAGGFITDAMDGREWKDVDVYTSRDMLFAPTRVDLIYVNNPMLFIARTFDFTVCSAAIVWRNGQWNSACHDDFYRDWEEKRLRFGEPEDRTLEVLKFARVMKWVAKGYTIDVEQMVERYGQLKDKNTTRRHLLADAMVAQEHTQPPQPILESSAEEFVRRNPEPYLVPQNITITQDPVYTGSALRAARPMFSLASMQQNIAGQGDHE